MQLVVYADSLTRAEWLEKGFSSEVDITWVENSQEFQNHPKAYAYFDLSGRATGYPYPKGKLVFLNAVVETLSDISHDKAMRINAWPGFLKRNLVEVVCNKNDEPKLKEIFGMLGWEYLITEDLPGMIAARVVSMIVNEAYFALGEGVSSKKEIDIAMRLGTNYPFGPFEWSERIGLDKIYSLLKKLGENDERYEIADAMLEELKNLENEISK